MDESSHRLSLRMEAGRLVSKMIPEFRVRYAGNDFTESPMVVTIRLTGSKQVPSRRFTTDHGPIIIQFSTGATHSIEQLKDVLRSAKLREMLPEAGGMGIDIKKGALYANIPDDYTGRAYSAEQVEIEQLLGVPIQLRKTRTATRTLALDPARAGARAVNNNNFCTFGFRAYTPAGAPGLITAGHCVDLLRYESVPGSGDNVITNLPVDPARRRFDAGHDVQFHPLPSTMDATWTIFMNHFGSEAVASLAEPWPEIVEGWAGFLILCHRGTRTGWSCGVLEDENHQPAPVACNNNTCTSDWLKISTASQANVLRCDGGDSGGPVVTNGLIPVAIATSAETEGPLDGQCISLVAMSLSKTQAAIGVTVK